MRGSGIFAASQFPTLARISAQGRPPTNIGIVSGPAIPPLLQAKDSIEQLAKEIALSETAVAILEKGRMIGDIAVKPNRQNRRPD